MTGTKIPCSCSACGHEWDQPYIALPVSFGRLVRALDGFVAAGCPKCGATDDNILIRPPTKEVEGERDLEDVLRLLAEEAK